MRKCFSHFTVNETKIKIHVFIFNVLGKNYGMGSIDRFNHLLYKTVFLLFRKHMVKYMNSKMFKFHTFLTFIVSSDSNEHFSICNTVMLPSSGNVG